MENSKNEAGSAAVLEADILVCPYCGNTEKIRVHSGGKTKEGYYFRVRECSECLAHWRTYEVHAKEFKRARMALYGLKVLVSKYGGDGGGV